MITKETFRIVKCSSCGFHFTNPIPEESKIGEYYKSEEYISHSSSNKGLINRIYNIVRNKTLKQKVQWLRNEGVGSRLLDIGSGTGHFLKVANMNGFSGTGLEPDSDARGFASSENGVACFPQSHLYSLGDASADVITMWHVLEHVYNLEKDIKEIARVLDKKGTLFIAVPNKNSFDARYYKGYWAAYDVPRHLYHFEEKDIKQLFAPFGFKLKKVLPMKYDAYYVSMLSEKYKKGFIGFGLLNGFRSNMKASKYGYSSQVYVLRRD